MGLVIEIRRLIGTLLAPSVPAEPGSIPPHVARPSDISARSGDRTTERADDGVEPESGDAPEGTSPLVHTEMLDALLPAARRDATARRDSPAHGGAVPAQDISGLRTAVDGTPATSTTSADVDGPVVSMQPEAHDLDGDVAAHLSAVTELVEALSLGFHLGGAVERIADAASRGRDGVPQLREATWMIERYVSLIEQRPIGADIYAASVRLSRAGDAIAELRGLTAALAEDVPVAPTIVEPPSGPIDAPAAEMAGSGERARPRSSSGSLARELTRMAVQSAILVIALVAAVLALTLIGDWR